MIYNTIDIRRLMKTISEIEIIKKIVFDKNQKKIFDVVSDTHRYNIDDMISQFKNKKITGKKYGDYTIIDKDVIEAYFNVKNQNDSTTSAMLYSMLDQEIKNYIDVNEKANN